MPQIGFPMAVATQVSGLTAWQIRHLSDSGLLRPELGVPSGKGSRARYSFYDLIMLRVAQLLGSEQDRLARALAELEKLRPGGWTQKLMVTTDWQSYFLYDDVDAARADRGAQALMVVIDLGLIDAQLRLGLGEFGLGAPPDPKTAPTVASSTA